MATAEKSIRVDAPVDRGSTSVRRKRRASTLLSSPQKPSTSTASQVSPPPQTPSRQKKRVRFSFPPDASTGLTQRIARTQLLSNSNVDDASTTRLLAHQPRRPRRAASVGSSQIVRLDSNNVEIQFKPLRQILTERSKRRLTRNHLSETMNEIEAEAKSCAALHHELTLVKQELQDVTAGREDVSEKSDQVQTLREEIGMLRRQMSGQTRSNSATLSVGTDSDAVDFVNMSDGEMSGPEGAGTSPQAGVDSCPGTPITPFSVFESGSVSPQHATSTSAHAQTEMSCFDMNEIQDHLQGQAKYLRDMRLSLEHLFPGETALPLASPTKMSSKPLHVEQFPLSDAKPLTSAIFAHLLKMSREAANTAKSLAAAETQQSVLNNNFRVALRQLDEVRSAHARLLAKSQQRPPRTPAPSPSACDHSSSPDKENAQPQSAQDYEALFGDAERRVQKLEENAALYQSDRAALIAALDKYRSEVKDLEKLVTNMENEHRSDAQLLRSEHGISISKLMAEHAEVIDSLETQVEMEASHRREAESEIDKIVCRWGDQRERSERDMGRLNVRIALLTDQLKDRERSVDELQQHLQAVRERVESFVSSVGGQLAWSDFEAGGGMASEPELPKSAPHRASSMPPTSLTWGLLTPSVEGGRFRDAMTCMPSPVLSSDPVVSVSVDGQVQIGRGKQRAIPESDSGFGILLEHPEEE